MKNLLKIRHQGNSDDYCEGKSYGYGDGFGDGYGYGNGSGVGSGDGKNI